MTPNADETHGWARSWLDEVASARAAIEAEERMQMWRIDRVRSMSEATAPARGPMGRGVTADRMRPVDELVDGEARLMGGPESTLRWAYDKIDQFDEAMARLRDGLSGGDVFLGSYAAEYRYRQGMSEREASRAMGCSRTTLRCRLAALCDYLDMVGPTLARP